MVMDGDACDCTRGGGGGGGGSCTDTVRESTLKADSGREIFFFLNPLPHGGLEPTSVLRLAFESNALLRVSAGETAVRRESTRSRKPKLSSKHDRAWSQHGWVTVTC